MNFFQPHPITVLALLSLAPAVVAADPAVGFQPESGKLHIQVGGQPFATYVYQDDKITRPYFCQVKAPGGIQATRNHPPIPGKDLTDHATFHPGIWLAFGDISGNDYWRIKAPVKHERLAEEPKGGPGRGAFAVRNRYLTADGAKLVCEETCRYAIAVRPAGTLLVIDSEFTSTESDFTFGDQEEMGLGVRVATPLSVKQAGEIINSAGAKNEAQAWGKPADWCDYGGSLDGRRVGLLLMPDPDNFRKSWMHARDYGVLVANPFGRSSFKAGDKSQVTVKKGERFRLRFGVLVYAVPADQPFDRDAAYRDFLKQIAK